ncbi:MAG: nitrate reductase molybdenum cofactor assembly chaperone [Gammaproteobacteria bacterium]|nr:nitrate reductase molybdenum cofactor assembly chaperone [Gammaproteobacteria bacterium]
MILYTVLSRLLEYPEQELVDNLELIRERINDESEVSPQERVVINEFVDYLQSQELLQLQQNYVNTFDMVPEHSLHLTHHLFGDEKNRGPALVDLGEHYKGMGYEIEGNEIPDYLPLVLEYVGTLDEMAARVFLADAHKVTTVLADNLKQATSPYALLLQLVEQRGKWVQAA